MAQEFEQNLERLAFQRHGRPRNMQRPLPFIEGISSEAPQPPFPPARVTFLIFQRIQTVKFLENFLSQSSGLPIASVSSSACAKGSRAGPLARGDEDEAAHSDCNGNTGLDGL